MEKQRKIDKTLFNGLFKKNAVLVGGLLIAPVVVINSFKLAVVYCIIFSIITFLTIIISSFIPREIAFAVRIILYSFIAALVYVPAIIIMNELFPKEIADLGVFVPLIVSNYLIVSKTELYLFKLSKQRMLIETVCYILGIDIAFIIFAFIREIISTGAIDNKIIGIPIPVFGFSYVFGGFILLGFVSAIFRKIYLFVRRKE